MLLIERTKMPYILHELLPAPGISKLNFHAPAFLLPRHCSPIGRLKLILIKWNRSNRPLRIPLGHTRLLVQHRERLVVSSPCLGRKLGLGVIRCVWVKPLVFRANYVRVSCVSLDWTLSDGNVLGTTRNGIVLSNRTMQHLGWGAMDIDLIPVLIRAG